MLKKIVCIFAALTIMTVVLAGCGKETPTPVVDKSPLENLIGDRVFTPLSEESQRYTVNLGYYNCDHMTAAVIGQDSGIFEALGIGGVNLTGNGRVPEAMAAGHMDMGYINCRTPLSAKLLGTPLFIAADNHTGGAEYLVVSHNIKEPQDLIGKRIAIDSAPTSSLNWMEWANALGIPSDLSNYEHFAMSDADEYFALVAGELDAFIACDPWGSMAEYEDTGWVMRRQNTDRPDGHGTCCKVVMSYDFAEKYPDLAERMILAHTLSVQHMYLHPYRSAEIFSNNYSVPLEVGLMTMYKKLNEEGRTIRWDLNEEYYQNQLNTLEAHDLFEELHGLDVRDFIDLTYYNNSGADDFETFLAEKVDPLFPLGMTYEEWRAKAVAVDGISE